VIVSKSGMSILSYNSINKQLEENIKKFLKLSHGCNIAF
jgi:hypothetical protein